jgi:hypothetical protein
MTGVTSVIDSAPCLDSLVAAVRDEAKVTESPHDLYRYPARFSPIFTRRVIQVYTDPGDTILDPFCGGGTTIAEAMRLGRRAIGIDVSSLATFLSRTKTTPLSETDKCAILYWVKGVRAPAGRPCRDEMDSLGIDAYYIRNLPARAVAFLGSVIGSLAPLTRRQRNFVRLSLLATGQWALDCKSHIPSSAQMLRFFRMRLTQSLDPFSGFFADAAAINGVRASRMANFRRILNRSSEQCHTDARIPQSWLPIRLVLTSPPYPGVHVLYHRWQIRGRKETPAPFWIANQKDGAGEAYYALGRRDEATLSRYYERLHAVFLSVKNLLDTNSRVVQLVAFSNPSWQLPAYLAAMAAAGFEETTISGRSIDSRQRIWRSVPGRKWYATLQQKSSAGREVLLVHKPSHQTC